MFERYRRTADAPKRKPWGKGLLSTLGTLALVAGFTLAAPVAANATGGHDNPPPTQDVGCETISANYHRALKNGDHINVTVDPPGGQVNMYVDQNVAGGASYDGQNNLGLRWKILGVEQAPIPLTFDQITSGVITFNYSAGLKAQGINSWKVTFVQTNSTDTWPGTECGEKPPVKGAKASVAVDQAATCTSPSTVTFFIKNATWDGEPDLSPGTHSRPATADKGVVFDDGQPTTSVPYTIEDKKPEQSSDPKADCYVPPKTTDAKFTAPTVIDKCGTADDKVVFGTSEDGTYSEATLAGDNGTIVHEVTFHPAVGTKVPAPGPDDTYVILNGNAVWTFTTTDEKCPPQVVDNNPQYTAAFSCGKVVLTFSNAVGLKPGEVADDAVFTYTDATGKDQEVTVAADAADVTIPVELAEDSGFKVVFYGIKGSSREFVEVPTDCKPNPVPVTPEGPGFVDKCGVTDDRYDVPGELVKATSSTDDDGNVERRETYETDKGTYQVVDTTIDGKRDVKITFTTSVPAGVITEPGKGDTYEVVNHKVVWTYSFTDEKCPVPPTTPPTTPPATPPTGHEAPQPPKPPVKGLLAATGGVAPLGALAFAIGALGLGAGVRLFDKRRQRKQA